MLRPDVPALVLAPMDGVTDAPMRALQGASRAFTFAVSEFVRVSAEPIPRKVFLRDVPELSQGGRTSTGLPVQVQILGGHAGRMAESAFVACNAGAQAIDINFGCPAPTVNRHDGGAALLAYPFRIREIVAAVRAAVPAHVPVSAKLRLGWDNVDAIHENAAMAAEGGASWLTIHARTKCQGYAPPVYWGEIGRVRKALQIPIIANGDIWTYEDFLRCRDETGCDHFMIGRGALANPTLPVRIATELGIGLHSHVDADWTRLFRYLVDLMPYHPAKSLTRLKQWMKIAYAFGDFPYFHELKARATLEEFFEVLEGLQSGRDNRRLHLAHNV